MSTTSYYIHNTFRKCGDQQIYPLRDCRTHRITLAFHTYAHMALSLCLHVNSTNYLLILFGVLQTRAHKRFAHHKIVPVEVCNG